jgi:hypothetical protein
MLFAIVVDTCDWLFLFLFCVCVCLFRYRPLYASSFENEMHAGIINTNTDSFHFFDLLNFFFFFLFVLTCSIGIVVHDKLLIYGGLSFSDGLLDQFFFINTVTINAGVTEK